MCNCLTDSHLKILLHSMFQKDKRAMAVEAADKSQALLAAGDFQGALINANSSIAWDPAFARARSIKGTALYAQKRYKDCKKAFSMGLKIWSDDAALIEALQMWYLADH